MFDDHSIGPWAILAALCLASCGAPTSAEDDSSIAQAITGGTLVDHNGVPYSAVVVIDQNCTATAIDTTSHFLTAGHCLLDYATGDLIDVTVNRNGRVGSGVTARITSLHLHPSINLTDSEAIGANAFDVAVFDLDRPVPGVVPVALDRDPPGNGTSVTVVGYGCDDRNPANDGQKQAAVFQVETIPKNFLPVDIATANNISTHDLGFHGSNLGGCEGDSGGPWLRKNGSGNWGVVGVTSFAYIDLPDIDTFAARVANTQQWLRNPGENQFVGGEQGIFLNPESTFCLDIASSGAVQTNYCDGRGQPFDEQFWFLVSVGGGMFQILQSTANDCMGVSGSQVVSTACVAGAPTSSQKWRFVPDHSNNGHEYFRLQNANGSCLSMAVLPARPGPPSAPVPGVAVHMQQCAGPGSLAHLGEDILFSR
jgi:hypothetical protein